MSYRSKIPGAFGEIDFNFATHPLDAERAIGLLKVCYQSNVPMKELLESVKEFLHNSGASNAHIEEQLIHVNTKFSGWLN